MPFGMSDEQYGVFWYLGESVSISIIFLGFFYLVWNTNNWLFWKFIISAWATLILYDVFRHFVYVRYLLWRQTMEQPRDPDDLVFIPDKDIEDFKNSKRKEEDN
jgi:hypothetical protein